KGRHIELTDAGKVLVPLARHMVRFSHDIQKTMDSLKGEVYGTLVVGCSTTPGKYIMPKLLARFHEQYPQVVVACKEARELETINMLQEGDIHIALISRCNDHLKDAEIYPFGTEKIVLIAPVEHPWARKGSIVPADLALGKFIFPDEADSNYQTIRTSLEMMGIGILTLNSVITLGNSEAIAMAVQEGIGVAFVSEMVYQNFCLNRVAPVLVQGLLIQQDIHIGFQTNRPPSIAQETFKKFILSTNIQDMLNS
ncbi:MAG: hypothetical protein HGA28_06645, partial [Anaerolineaceae bacterium]|nr:hypothetical protein [Anaerolineaceae bacterium]